MSFLGVDIGTSGTKTVLFSETGEKLASASREYPLYQPQNGWAEQDPLDWWNAVYDTIREVIAKSGIHKTNIAGIGLSGQMHGLVMLDSDGVPLRRAILWCDGRCQSECEEIKQIIGEEKLVKIAANPALPGFTAPKILWVRRHEPQIFEKCRHILLPKDYIRYKLTGEFATEVSDASGTLLLDVPNRIWSNELLERLEIDASLLPSVYESAEISGSVCAAAAELCGLSEGTPVVGGAGDNAAAAVGTGTVRRGTAFTTIGTSGVVYAHTDDIKIDPLGRVHSFCAAVPGEWHVMGVTQAAGLSLKWFRDNFCGAEIETARGMGVDPYSLLDTAAEKIPIGSGGLLFLPYLMGERTPHLNSSARGVFFGLSAVHTRFNLLRAVMEGVSFSQRDSLEILYEMNIPINSMLACGGGAVSAVWRQMLSDIYNLPVCVCASTDAPALGAMILAAVGTNVYSSVNEACDKIIKTSSECLPNCENHAIYSEYYSLYRALYPALKNQFDALEVIK